MEASMADAERQWQEREAQRLRLVLARTAADTMTNASPAPAEDPQPHVVPNGLPPRSQRRPPSAPASARVPAHEASPYWDGETRWQAKEERAQQCEEWRQYQLFQRSAQAKIRNALKAEQRAAFLKQKEEQEQQKLEALERAWHERDAKAERSREMREQRAALSRVAGAVKHAVVEANRKTRCQQRRPASATHYRPTSTENQSEMLPPLPRMPMEPTMYTSLPPTEAPMQPPRQPRRQAATPRTPAMPPPPPARWQGGVVTEEAVEAFQQATEAAEEPADWHDHSCYDSEASVQERLERIMQEQYEEAYFQKYHRPLSPPLGSGGHSTSSLVAQSGASMVAQGTATPPPEIVVPSRNASPQPCRPTTPQYPWRTMPPSGQPRRPTTPQQTVSPRGPRSGNKSSLPKRIILQRADCPPDVLPVRSVCSSGFMPVDKPICEDPDRGGLRGSMPGVDEAALMEQLSKAAAWRAREAHAVPSQHYGPASENREPSASQMQEQPEEIYFEQYQRSQSLVLDSGMQSTSCSPTAGRGTTTPPAEIPPSPSRSSQTPCATAPSCAITPEVSPPSCSRSPQPLRPSTARHTMPAEISPPSRGGSPQPRRPPTARRTMPAEASLPSPSGPPQAQCPTTPRHTMATEVSPPSPSRLPQPQHPMTQQRTIPAEISLPSPSRTPQAQYTSPRSAIPTDVSPPSPSERSQPQYFTTQQPTMPTEVAPPTPSGHQQMQRPTTPQHTMPTEVRMQPQRPTTPRHAMSAEFAPPLPTGLLQPQPPTTPRRATPSGGPSSQPRRPTPQQPISPRGPRSGIKSSLPNRIILNRSDVPPEVAPMLSVCSSGFMPVERSAAEQAEDAEEEEEEYDENGEIRLV
eukprot:TRINITY_DN16978_c0_g1_i1.p1 TRINITY_DN16978_c0_g1~~TRINITY_DN16978_c0_g1_i1.p1  ORF type:complete len:863 (+),score=147.86 TRINITY_DN16978_c0_g1_i1:164-2752(+)